MCSSRSSASSNGGEGDAVSAGDAIFLATLYSPSLANRLDPRVGFAAREFHADQLSDRQRAGGSQQGTVAPASEAIAPLEHQARRQRAQAVGVAGETDAPLVSARDHR